MQTQAALDPQLVHEFVLKAHADLERVQQLLEQEPLLVNAVTDWGGGDWETGLGSAAHMGNRPIATYLIEHGARIDIFAAAMLGHLDIVKAIITQYPAMRHARGPHTIPLIAHAEAGGTEAADVLRFLKEE